jgi:hypothetical protein
MEGELEDIIIAHLENWEDTVSVSRAVEAYVKYYPLLSKMTFIWKLKACSDYGYIKKDKEDFLWSLLNTINDIRDNFAHYQCYQYKLQTKYKTLDSRIKVLTDLLKAMELLSKRKNQIFYKSLA